MPAWLVGWLIGALIVFIFVVPAAALVGLPRQWPIAAGGAAVSALSYWRLLPRYEECAANDLYCQLLLTFVEQTAFSPAPVCWVALAIIIIIKTVSLARR